MDAADSWGSQRGSHDRQWRLTADLDGMALTVGDRTVTFAGEDLDRLSVRRSWFGSRVLVAGEPQLRLSGLRRREVARLDAELSRLRARHRAAPALAAARGWYERATAVKDAAVGSGRWVSREAVDRLGTERPSRGLVDALRQVPDLVVGLSAADRRAVEFLDVDLIAWFAGVNETVLANEMRERAEFFDTVEARPLTDEQIRAVVCMDNRVHVIASAGSGKTSVMVARAAYAIMRGFVPPERVLLLAFNRDAAVELRARVVARLDAMGLPSAGLTATTFHAFGLHAIGEATGRKPRLAEWLDGGRDVEMVCRIVDELRERSPQFAYRWDLFRLLYSRPTETPDAGEPDGYDRTSRTTGFRTAHGEVVKSEGERIIADWLFFNGVRYEYEKPFVVDTANAEHSQYRPDFFYPDIEVWHEHWALDHTGRPPQAFHGYAESMRWKKQLHARHGTTLVETTWAEIIDYSGLERLGRDLRVHGAALDWNPDRHVPGLKPLQHEDLARLVRSFMTHVKSNSLTRESLNQRIGERTSAASAPRTRLFVELYWQIHDAWQARLRAADAVDFEDMLVEAAEHLERGTVTPRHDLVMVDEFQDASQARARLTRALVAPADTYLLAVGDDWQSINRFAGADISVMTEFAQWFGPGPTLRLQTTFRCAQSITDVAGEFVAKNPRQLRKDVRSARQDPGQGVLLVRAPDAAGVPDAIASYLDRLAARVASGDEPQGRAGQVEVFVLGRYHFDRDLMPRRSWAGLNVAFKTAHGSKGLEADYVVIPNLTRGRFGFPSTIHDDPVLDLVMADPDPYPHAEERRLFYVALTRARCGVALFAVAGQESPFVVELVQEGKAAVHGEADAAPVQVCPACGSGTLVTRRGPYGPFLGCSTFPRCRHTARIPPAPAGQ